MNALFDKDARAPIHRRIDSLGLDRPALWGRMNAHQVVCHLADQLRIALGDIKTESRPGPLTADAGLLAAVAEGQTADGTGDVDDRALSVGP